MKKDWFKVDTKGLKALQEGKSKTFIIRELVQNAFDEEINHCYLNICWLGDQKVVITCEDDSPEGFKHIEHAYTLYADTYKRGDVTKRGRFNLGEKEVLSMCEYAEIRTTKGTIRFSDSGRENTSKKRKQGSEIFLQLKMKKSECSELIEYAKMILCPPGVEYYVNNDRVPFKTWFRTTEEKLQTEVLIEGALRPTRRNTLINIHEAEKPLLYELGIPVCEIDCAYSLDVQQKVPLSTDRTKVSASYLKDLYAAVLNDTHDQVTEANSSDSWIRVATTSDKIETEAVETVIEKRYGNKVVVANPADPASVDRAISEGYRVIRGGEMNREEWNNVRRTGAVESSSTHFGSTSTSDFKFVEPTAKQERIENFIKRIAIQLMNMRVNIRYLESKSISYLAEYGNSGITFNLTRIPDEWWTVTDKLVHPKLLELIIHELAHEKGWHYEKSYQDELTRLGVALVYKMKKNPKFFEV